MRSIISPRTLSGLAFVLATGALSAQSITVINMTPRSLSGETNCDGEPSIAVNPANPLQMAGTAFTPDPAAGSMAPYYVSTDGGNTWTLNTVMPGGSMTSDVSLRFGTTSNVLYAGILRADNTNLNILRTSGFSLSNPMSILVDRASDDQPFVDARTVNGADRVYIGNNNFAASVSSQTATVDLSTNAATAAAPAGFAPASAEARATSGQDGPSVRAASAPDGRVYAALLGWRSGSSTFVSDVVVVRDDAGATGSSKFQSLLGSDGLAGTKVATGQNMTFNSQLGSDRVGSSLAIAVDPTDSLTVYVAWGEDGTGGGWTLHLRRSTDGGATWSSDLRTVVGATNPALAINNAGEVGFFYQKLTGGIWNNQADFAPKNDPFTNPTTIVLANLADGSTGTCGQPTIGDYSGLIAVGADFYGVFSGDNTPNSANFPHGITYQRQVNWSSQQLLSTDGVTQVSTSLDPFFFHISGLGTTATAPSITTQPASTTVNAGATATFSVGASGTAPLSYQWQKNGTNIGGATSASYTTPATTSTDNGATFSATVSNAAGSATSNNATLTVVSAANTVTASITTPASNVTLASGTNQSFVGAGTDSSSTATLSYSWTFGDGVSATGASASHIYTNTGSTAVTYTATLKVTDNTGVSSTATRTITVNPAAANTVTASITTPASNVTIASGTAQSFAGTGTDSSSTATLSYAWTFGDGGTATGASASHTYTNTGSTAVTYTATLKVTDNTGISNTATRAITVNPASGGGTTTTQVLGNPGFETGTASPWVMTSGVLDNGTSEAAHSGSWKAWLCGYGSTHTDTVMQQVAIPSNATAASLSFWLHIDTAEISGTHDTLAVQVRNSAGTVLGTLATYSNLNANTGYTQVSFDLSAYKGQTIQINLVGSEDAANQTSFVVDDFALNVTTSTTTPNTVTASITAPASNVTVASGTAQSFAGSATDSSSTATLTYAWNFGDGSTATGASASHTFTNTGTAAVAYTVTFTATDNTGVSSSATRTVTVNPATTGGTELFTNGGFESGTTGWTTTSGVIGANGPSEPAHSGTQNAWLDGYGSAHTDYVSQQIAVPASGATLTFWLHIDTAETTTTSANDTMQVQVLNSAGTVLGTLATYSNLNAAAGYTQRSFSLAPYAGQTVTIKFLGVENASLQTSFVLDDVSAK